jgi:hypothetical protein
MEIIHSYCAGGVAGYLVLSINGKEGLEMLGYVFDMW